MARWGQKVAQEGDHYCYVDFKVIICHIIDLNINIKQALL